MRGKVKFMAACAASLGLAGPALAADLKADPLCPVATPAPEYAGARKDLYDKGVNGQLVYLGEAHHVASGGVRRGTPYIGRLEATLEFDFCKLAGWRGASAKITAFNIHGSGPSRSYVGNLMTITEIEALPTTRLWEAWLQQEFADGKFSIRAGQMGADSEFFVADSADVKINGTFGWPMMFGSNLPSGGPAFPFSAVGVRAKYAPSENLAFLLGIFNGDPAGPGLNDPQLRNRHGLNFRVRDPAFVMAEAQLGYKLGDLEGKIKIGGWRHFGSFSDQRFGTDGLSLANPLSNGVAASHRGNWSVYGVLDQTLMQVKDRAKLAFFARAAISPTNRNLIDSYVDAGLIYSGFRDGKDSINLGLAYGNISKRVSGFDADSNFFNGVAAPVRSHEALIEVSYKYEPTSWLYVQPILQYVINPGGHVADPNDPTGTRPVRNATVLGLRLQAKY